MDDSVFPPNCAACLHQTVLSDDGWCCPPCEADAAATMQALGLE